MHYEETTAALLRLSNERITVIAFTAADRRARTFQKRCDTRKALRSTNVRRAATKQRYVKFDDEGKAMIRKEGEL